MLNNFQTLNNRIIKCKNCPRLVKFREKVAANKRKQYLNEEYWGKPINGFLKILPSATGLPGLIEIFQKFNEPFFSTTFLMNAI